MSVTTAPPKPVAQQQQQEQPKPPKVKMMRVQYDRKKDREFSKELQRRVNAYFKDNDKTKFSDWRMWIKTASMLAMLFVPFAILLTGTIQNIWALLGLYVLMGVGTAGIGLSVMHDANHGSYSRNQTVNKALGLLLNMVGGHDTTWKIQHNVLHHTYTNVDGLDEDIDPGPLIRLSPHKPLKGYHKMQHIYAWFFYGLLTIFWVVFKDFKQLKQYNDKGLLAAQRTTLAKEIGRVIVSKIVYLGYILGLPLFFTDYSPWLIMGGFVLAHFVAGLLLSAIFQAAHVVEEAEYPMPVDGKVSDNFAVHQMKTTANFAPNNRILSWYVGGLNYQVEHHLFPHICHIHYRALSPIIEGVAKEYGVPYNSQTTFRQAIGSHFRQLKALGRA